ncbi:CpTSP8,predicted extracellular protein with 3 TSP1 repeats, an EGF domain and a C-terminal transmembrane domain. adjacent TSP domain containing gene [Cryptosporidium parvum Iowa II]|nr:CpTSP8,predicted extracellular protein with 3 TSP1 repeats, an EGF domain and a C-terminal transmembrane domain. adjacent TSP domain containing gene [Cryptosporidium parvum Iowa II]EAK90179.1 putative extracellular protein [Cryptosporidium parvum Iowa II]WKS78186.1 CpTSP8 [Cryptosporidium sp. 43IA8]
MLEFRQYDLKFMKIRRILYFILIHILIFNILEINSLPPSFSWTKAWKDITSEGLVYTFSSNKLPWYSGVSFRIVGKFNAENDKETLVTIQNGDLYHCKLMINFAAQTVDVESTGYTSEERWARSYAYFPFPYKPKLMDLDLVVEKLRWPGGFYFYISGSGPYYPCHSIVYSNVNKLTFGNGQNNFSKYKITRNVPLADPYRRTYFWDEFQQRYYFDDKNLYYVNSTGIDEKSGVPNGDRIPKNYKSWPEELEIHLHSASMYPVNDKRYGWGGTVAVFTSDQSQFYYRMNGFFATLSSNSYCLSSGVLLSGTSYTVSGDYPFDFDNPGQPFNSILINKKFGVDVFVRESLWSLGTIFHCGVHSYKPESVGLIYPNEAGVYSTTRFAISTLDCEYSQWSSWLPCTSTCNGGTTYRWRYPLNEVMAGGLECTITSQISACNSDVECLPCGFTDWGSWSPCSASCDGGLTIRTRELTHSAPGCDSLLKETSSCNSSPCPVDCVLSFWSPWTGCSKFLCEGTKSRYRVVVREAMNGGTACPSSNQLRQVVECSGCEGICDTQLEPICQNSGECFNIGNDGYYCKCAEGFYGRNCTISSDNKFNIILGTSSGLAVGLLVILFILLLGRSRN